MPRAMMGSQGDDEGATYSTHHLEFASPSRLRRAASTIFGRIRNDMRVADSATETGFEGRTSKPKWTRLINKSTGRVNVRMKHVKFRKRHVVRDFYTTLLDLSWLWIFAWTCLVLLGSWLIFGVLWFSIAVFRGDIPGMRSDVIAPNHSNCVMNVNNFTSAFLFSLETQTTIGYGYRVISDRCPIGVLLLIAQTLVGVIIQAGLCAVMAGKLVRPQPRAGTVRFCPAAVVTKVPRCMNSS